MKLVMLACLVVFLMLIESPSEAQIDVDGRMGQSNAGALGGLPPELISKIQALAVLLQQKTAEGKINDGAIQQHMQSGDAAGAIRGLGPEAERLLNDIKSAFQSNYSEESLNVLLQALMSASPAAH
jgi:hypothetical protein